MATTAKFPKIICRVKALYAFSSTEKSSLSFEKDEYIEVLSQLDSGWWDGWCKGNRGWFPSNYVQIIDVNPDLVQDMNHDFSTNNGRDSPIAPSPYPPRLSAHNQPEYDDDSEEEARTINLIRNMNSGNSSNTSTPMTLSRPHSLTMSSNKPASYPSSSSTPPPIKSPAGSAINKRNHQLQQLQQEHIQHTVRPQLHDEEDEENDLNLPDGWALQTADDGFTKFYFNQQTGGLRWSHPGISDSDDDDHHDDDSSGDEEYHMQHQQQNIQQQRKQQMDHFDDYDFGQSTNSSQNSSFNNYSVPPHQQIKERSVNVSWKKKMCIYVS
jgi:hypothetical protein